MSYNQIDCEMDHCIDIYLCIYIYINTFTMNLCHVGNLQLVESIATGKYKLPDLCTVRLTPIDYWISRWYLWQRLISTKFNFGSYFNGNFRMRSNGGAEPYKTI